jgi:hypothetical protein
MVFVKSSFTENVGRPALMPMIEVKSNLATNSKI